MRCNEVEKWIELLVDNEISSLLKKDVEAHVGECQSCGRILENTRALKKALKNSLPLLTPPSHLDASVMEAFYRRHGKREASEATAWKSAIFQRIVIPKPVFALSALLLAALLGIAFQLGRVSVSSIQSSELSKDLSESSQQASDNPAPPVRIIEIPVVKIVETPVVKEKIVTRYVYVNKQNQRNNQVKSILDNSRTYNLELNGAIAGNGYITQTNLKGFQPTAEIKIAVQKGGEENEK